MPGAYCIIVLQDLAPIRQLMRLMHVRTFIFIIQHVLTTTRPRPSWMNRLSSSCCFAPATNPVEYEVFQHLVGNFQPLPVTFGSWFLVLSPSKKNTFVLSIGWASWASTHPGAVRVWKSSDTICLDMDGRPSKRSRPCSQHHGKLKTRSGKAFCKSLASHFYLFLARRTREPRRFGVIETAMQLSHLEGCAQLHRSLGILGCRFYR